MNKNINKYILGLSFLSMTWWSCTEMDAYKDFIPDGEKTYSGKIDSLTIIGGDHRVMVWGLFKADPKIEQARISWNAGAESITVPINRTSGVDTLKHIVEDLEENNFTFEVVTIDNEGNESVPVYATGSAYGERYRTALNHRPIATSNLTVWDSNTKLVFGEIDDTSGALYSEVAYIDAAGAEHIVKVPLDTEEVVLENYSVGEAFKVRTFYRPEAYSMDTFSTVYSTNIPKVTYMRNMQVPFEAEARSGRWGNLAHWTTNDNAKIHGGYGGWDEWNNNIFNLESGWGAPAVNNGKIYQTFDVPVGSFTFKIKDLRDTNLTENDDAYLVVVLGDELPDVENLDSAIGYTQIIAGKALGELKVDFEIEEGPVQISVGYLTTQPDGSPGRYCNIRAFDFTQH
ncbi:DUF5013 domain-containing protein [Echinicola marina]|uniref:DUF4998 domain-containing protein n=1 Tax=Echinicola marina TaxID=2859768 RepID=UPI001CF7073A|nr:DUF4998 domain-containing protein [Echinicola marina]UCS93891.1 DUF5013 domain-containing protein [Echinicola marina]